jgi:GNAT superfamily N-acetyltransferase
VLKVYEEAIPPSERKSADAVTCMLERPDYRVLGAFSDRRLVGFSIVYDFRELPLRLLEYMAVSSGWRGRGIGRRLFQELIPATKYADPMLLEVDSDRVASADHELRAARKRFYKRMGCRELAGLTYQLPLPGKPPPMDILVLWPSQRRVKRATIKEWVTALYVEVYAQSESDPRIPAMLASLPAQVPLV